MRSRASMSSPQIPDKNRRELYRSLQARSTAPNARTRARPSRQVVKIGDFGITQRAEELDTAISLIVPMLHEQPTTRPEAIVGAHRATAPARHQGEKASGERSRGGARFPGGVSDLLAPPRVADRRSPAGP